MEPSWLDKAGLGAGDLERVRALASRSGMTAAAAARRLGLLSDDRAAALLAEAAGWPLAGAELLPLAPPEAAHSLSAAFLRDVLAAPLERDGRLYAALGDPENAAALAGIEAACGRAPEPVIVPAGALEAALERWYAGGEETGEAPLSASLDDADADHIRDLASEAPVVRLVNELIADALGRRASDIHIEPYRDLLRFRMRIDGVLIDASAPAASLARLVASRIKIMAGLDIAERRKPQDGRARVTIAGRALDLRVATAPTAYGESLTIRLLEDSAATVNLDDLGLEGPERARLMRALSAPNGLILVTGPTGAGKTTTLAGSVLHLNAPDRKIISIEDPVEYQIEGVNQIAVRPAVGLTFATALRSVLRHDPDVIVIGELRDGETAEIAVNAAMTGHLVLATLHANSAAAAAPRLLDMGVDAGLLRSNLNLIVAQRLVRALCPDCRTPGPQGAEIAGERRADLATWTAAGCDQCQGLGYRGRLGVFEMIEPDAAFRAAIQAGGSAVELERLARGAGASSLLDNAFALVGAGRTSVAEAVRVFGR